MANLEVTATLELDGLRMKGIVFDWDGTLADIDERELYCINTALATADLGPVSREFYVQNYYRRAYEVGTGPRMDRN